MRLLTSITCLLATYCFAQVRPVYSSVESFAAGAKAICVGKIAKIEEVRVDGFDAIELTIHVSETLKGKTPERPIARRFGKEARTWYATAQEAGVEFVWFFPGDTARTDLCLDQRFSEYQNLHGLGIGMDYSIINSSKGLLDRIREFVRQNPRAGAGTSLLTPLPSQSLTGFVDFLVPVGPWTEKLAVRMITKPDSFQFGPPTGNPYDPSAEPLWPKYKEGMLRTEGLILLQHFKSNANVRLVKRYLKDDSVAMKQKQPGDPITLYYWVRDAAYRLLRCWDVEVDQPVVDGPVIAYRLGLYMVGDRRFDYVFKR